MMPVSPLISGPSGASTSTAAGLSLKSTDFMQLLIAQLQNQDPLNPVSNTEFASQLAQFSSLQGINDLNTDFASLLQLQQLTQGTNLVGKSINYTTAGSSGQRSGIVSGILLQNGQLQLLVDG